MKKIIFLVLLFPSLTFAQFGTGAFGLAGNMFTFLMTDSIAEKTPGHGINIDPLYIDQANGRVGIGMTSPAKLFELSDANGSVTLNGLGINFTRTTAYIQSTNKLVFQIGPDSYIFNNGSPVTEKMRITSLGNIGIGTAFPDSATLQIAAGVGAHELWLGDATTYSYIDAGDAGWTSSSTKNVKENIIDVSGIDLKKFKLVKPKKYNFRKSAFLRVFKPEYVAGWDTLTAFQRGKERAKWLQKEDKRASSLAAKRRVGFIAEDVGLLLGKPNKKEINQMELIAILWLKVQELEKRIEVLEGR
jgi:hypothetical protein